MFLRRIEYHELTTLFEYLFTCSICNKYFVAGASAGGNLRQDVQAGAQVLLQPSSARQEHAHLQPPHPPEDDEPTAKSGAELYRRQQTRRSRQQTRQHVRTAGRYTQFPPLRDHPVFGKNVHILRTHAEEKMRFLEVI